MNKKKAVVCTILYVIVITVILTASFFIKSTIIEISLYQLIVNVIGNMCIANSVPKFYEWLRKQEK